MSHDLEPTHTAQVPETELHSKPNNIRTFFGEYLPTPLKKAVAIAAMGGMLGGGIYVAGRFIENDRADRSIATASAPAIPGQSTSSTSESAPSVSPSTVEAQPSTNPNSGAEYKFESEVLKQTVSIEAMDAMSLDDYAKLSYADRLAYAIAKTPSNSGFLRATESNELALKDPEMIPGYYWTQYLGISARYKDPIEAAKIGSTVNYYSENQQGNGVDPSYENTTSFIEKVVNNGLEIDDTYVYVKSGDWQTWKDDRTGRTVDYMNITYKDVSSSTGNQIGQVVTTQAIRVKVKLLDGTIVMAYPMGYGADGTQSPVADRNY